MTFKASVDLYSINYKESTCYYYDESKNNFALIVSAVIVDICTHAKIRSMMFKFNNCGFRSC